MRILLGLAALATASTLHAQGAGKPVIDMHMHAWSLQEFGGDPPPGCIGARGVDMHGVDPAKPFDFTAQATCKVMVQAPKSDQALLDETLKQMRKYNIVTGVISGDRQIVADWRKAAPGRFIPGENFFTEGELPPAGRASALEAQVKSGETQVFAEVTPQYRGLPPDHESLRPFYAMAERLDVPVGIHMGYGAPGGPSRIYPKYRASLGNPLLLEDLLVRHPKMRVYVMHAGMPMTDEMIMVMNAHPQVFVDISADNVGVPRAEFHHHLRRMVEAGYGKRILFGSDQMVWPQSMDAAIDAITEADYLSEEQKRDILYNNAARFLRLTPEQIAEHHKP